MQVIFIDIPFCSGITWDSKSQADVDRFVDDGSLDDNVESFLSHDDPEPRDRVGRFGDVSKGTINVDFFIIGGMCSHT